jgi:hypothetical protein
MPTEKSLSAYRLEKQNCAQSIYTGFRELLNVPREVIESARRLGGGKAEEGRCGALHAALDLSRREETRDVLRTGFEERAGSQQCREIKARKLLSCDQCVELAATLLEQHEYSHP